MKQIKAVIFDCDGVLLESEPLIGRVVYEYFREHGLGESFDEFMQRSIGKQDMEILNQTIREHDLKLPENHQQEIDDSIMDLLQGEIEAMQGVERMLQGLLLPKAVASNTPAFRLTPFLKAAGLADYFGQHIYSETHVAFPKPKPDLYLFAAEKLGVAPENCLVVEDSITGATAGLAAQMNVVGYYGGDSPLTNRPQNLLDLGVEHVFDHWDNFGEVLRHYDIGLNRKLA